MRGDASDVTRIFAECAGISEITGEHRLKVSQLVERILPPPTQEHGYTTLTEHHIDVQGARLFKHAPRRMSPKILDFAQREVKNMYEQGIIERSASEWCRAPVIVRKGDDDYRFCIDFRDLNKFTRRDTYPLPNMDAFLDKLRRAKFISKVDLKKAYHQILLSEESRQYTAFAVPESGL